MINKQDNKSIVATAVNAVRDSLAIRRTERQQHQILVRELADYSSPADRRDLEAIIDRYPVDQVRDVQEILDQQAVSYAA